MPGWSADALFSGENMRFDDKPFSADPPDDFGGPGRDE